MTTTPVRRRPIPLWLLLLLGMLLGTLLGVAIPVLIFIFEVPPTFLQPLPAPPAPADRIAGIGSSEWFEASVYVQTTVGDLYLWPQNMNWGGSAPDISYQAWEPATLPPATRDFACLPRSVARIEEVAGAVSACRAVQPVGEWCPSPRASYAIDGAGGVWLLAEGHRCDLLLTIALVYLVPGGFVVGLVVAGTLALIRYARRRRRAAEPPATEPGE